MLQHARNRIHLSVVKIILLYKHYVILKFKKLSKWFSNHPNKNNRHFKFIGIDEIA